MVLGVDLIWGCDAKVGLGKGVHWRVRGEGGVWDGFLGVRRFFFFVVIRKGITHRFLFFTKWGRCERGDKEGGWKSLTPLLGFET